MTRQESRRKWKLSHPERVSEDNRKHKGNLKRKAYEKLGNRCANPNCRWTNDDGTAGCVDTRCLQIDHIEGNGSIERKRGLNTQHFYYAIIADAAGYQLLCANCNWIKRTLNGEVRKPRR